MNKNILITLKKELRSIFRDKKTILRMLLFPLIIPAMIMLYGTIYDNMDSESNTYQIGINYEISAPEEEIAKSLNIEYIYYKETDDLEKAYQNEEIEGYLTYEENTYTIYTEQGNTTGLTINSLLSEYLETYNTYLTNTYLVNEGIDLDKAYNHFEIQYEDLSTTDYFLQLLLTVSLTYIIMSICLSASNMATSATAAEKENGTLETILTFPIKKTELIVGKYLASVIIGFITSLIGLVLMLISLSIAKDVYTMFENFNLIINFKTILGSLIIIFSASLFIAGAALALTCFSKTYKEAQSASQMLSMLSIIPMFVSLIEIKLNYYYYLIPICNYEQVLMDLFTSNINNTNILITFFSTIVYIVIVIIYIIKAYNSEKILFTN